MENNQNSKDIEELKKIIKSLSGQLENFVQLMNSVKRKYPYSFNNIDDNIYQANKAIYEANKKIG